MADLDQLKQKYAPVVAVIESFKDDGAQIEDESLDGDKLHLKATLPSQVVLNRVWDAIKQVDPQFADLHHSANHYGEIAKASGISNPDHVQVGQDVTVPVLA